MFLLPVPVRLPACPRDSPDVLRTRRIGYSCPIRFRRRCSASENISVIILHTVFAIKINAKSFSVTHFGHVRYRVCVVHQFPLVHFDFSQPVWKIKRYVSFYFFNRNARDLMTMEAFHTLSTALKKLLIRDQTCYVHYQFKIQHICSERSNNSTNSIKRLICICLNERI